MQRQTLAKAAVQKFARPDDQALTIPWQKPPSKRSRRILLPHKASRSDVRPEQFERRARLVSAIARGRRWLDDVVSGQVTTVAELCAREKCSVRQVNMTISLAFLAPNLVKAAVEGRLPRGIGVERQGRLNHQCRKVTEVAVTVTVFKAGARSTARSPTTRAVITEWPPGGTSGRRQGYGSSVRFGALGMVAPLTFRCCRTS